MKEFLPTDAAGQALYKMEIGNLGLYGYGIKSMVLSMIEAAMAISSNKLPVETIDRMIRMGQELIQKPVELLDGVENVLQQLHGKYQLILATKGDLLDQQRKLEKSGLQKYFQYVEVMSDKTIKDYQKITDQLGIKPDHFVMIGNSLKSDIIPVLELGGYAFHVPYETTWEHEKVEHQVTHKRMTELEKIEDLLQYL